MVQSIQGVPRLTEGLNPATWMLQVSTPGMEANIGVNFSEIYKQSQLFQYVHLVLSWHNVTWPLYITLLHVRHNLCAFVSCFVKRPAMS